MTGTGKAVEPECLQGRGLVGVSKRMIVNILEAIFIICRFFLWLLLFPLGSLFFIGGKLAPVCTPPLPSRFPSTLEISLRPRPQEISWSREISWASGMDFPIPPSFWWSTDTVSNIFRSVLCCFILRGDINGSFLN